MFGRIIQTSAAGWLMLPADDFDLWQRIQFRVEEKSENN
jgi:hypothetical protein